MSLTLKSYLEGKWNASRTATNASLRYNLCYMRTTYTQRTTVCLSPANVHGFVSIVAYRLRPRSQTKSVRVGVFTRFICTDTRTQSIASHATHTRTASNMRSQSLCTYPHFIPAPQIHSCASRKCVRWLALVAMYDSRNTYTQNPYAEMPTFTERKCSRAGSSVYENALYWPRAVGAGVWGEGCRVLCLSGKHFCSETICTKAVPYKCWVVCACRHLFRNPSTLLIHSQGVHFSLKWHDEVYFTAFPSKQMKK